MKFDSSKALNDLQEIYIYIYIYICMFVCVCVGLLIVYTYFYTYIHLRFKHDVLGTHLSYLGCLTKTLS